MFGGRFLNARYVNLSLRLRNLASYSESNDILSLPSYFQSKGGTFLRHPVVKVESIFSISLSLKIKPCDTLNQKIDVKHESSAYRSRLQSTACAMSFTYTRKMSGPRIDP